MGLSTKRALPILFLCLVLILAFQNCSPVPTFTSESQASNRSSSGGGSGDGFEGKPFVELLASGNCTDGSNVNTKIYYLSDNQGLLTRGNCVNLPKDQVKTVPVQLSQDKQNLTYNSITLQLAVSEAIWLQSAEKWAIGSQTSSVQTDPFSKPSSQGTAIICAIEYHGVSTPITGVQDSNGNTYTRINQVVGVANVPYSTGELWYASNINSGTSLTVTAQFSGASTEMKAITCHEYSGVAAVSPLDQTYSSTGISQSVNAGPFAMASSNVLMFTWLIGEGVATIDSTFSLRSSQSSNAVADKMIRTPGDQYIGGTTNPGAWTVILATFRLK